jgi:hypothetical protein
MNPGAIDLPATYAAPLVATPGTPRRGPSGSAAPAFATAVPLWVGRLTPPTKTVTTDPAGGPRATSDTTFLARWSAALADGGRLVVEGRTYDITGITPAPNQPRRSWVHIACQHVVGVNTATAPVTAFP